MAVVTYAMATNAVWWSAVGWVLSPQQWHTKGVSHESNTSSADLPQELVDQIVQCQFFAKLVIDSVALATGDEPIDAFLVHHEATFTAESIGRHLSVLVLTPTRLVVCHTDENPGERDAPRAMSSTESVPVRLLGTVTLARVVSRPEQFGSDSAETVETWLTLCWNSLRRIDLEPASCGDPTCTAEHCLTGSVLS